MFVKWILLILTLTAHATSSSNDCKTEVRGIGVNAFHGTISHSDTDNPCLDWSGPGSYGVYGYACRDNTGGPWCFVDNPDVFMDCNIRLCNA